MKSLIFLAGPHRSDSSEVNYFFHKYATSTADNGLNGWLWPEIEGELPGQKHEYFENFFWNQNNNTIQDVLMQGIRDAWDESQHGIIIGADGFDNTRGSSKSMALKTMNKIIDSLGVEPLNVYVAMMYKSPRLDQWVNLFHHNSNGDYEDFVCNDDYAEHLANIDMNPLMLAHVYRAQGWNVATVDISGVQMVGGDIGHSIACELLPTVECQDGWIRDLQDQTTEHEIVNMHEFNSLPPEKKAELEGMFLARDCYYRDFLETDESFLAIHKSTLWSDCDNSDYAQARYKQLTDAVLFFDLIKNQVGCSQLQGPISLPGADGSSRDGTSIMVVVAAVLTILIMTYVGVARFKRRQTRGVRSPKRNWINDDQDAFNLQSPTMEYGEITFEDVDLKSPRFTRQQVADATSAPVSTLVAIARQGRSVRDVYKDGHCHGPPAVQIRRHKGDSELEIKIKSLEAEIS